MVDAEEEVAEDVQTPARESIPHVSQPRIQRERAGGRGASEVQQYLNPFEAVGRNSVKSCAPDVSDLKYAQTNRGGRLSAAITSFT
nr:uncharacterized protein LOC108019557 isoform X2 [Drosophila suzukii]